MNKIPKFFLAAIVDIFKIFKSVFDLIEPFKKITLSNVAPSYYVGLAKLYQVSKNFEIQYPIDLYEVENGVINTLCDELNSSIQDKVELLEIHYAAAFLDPTFKDFNFVPSPSEHIQISTKFLVKIYNQVNVEYDDIVVERQDPSEISEDDILASARSNTVIITKKSKLAEELNQYKLLSSPPQSPEEFWKKNEHLFPTIGKLAKHILCIPATSSGPERHFSISGKVGNPGRSSLTAEKLCSQSFVACNLKNKSFEINKLL